MNRDEALKIVGAEHAQTPTETCLALAKHQLHLARKVDTLAGNTPRGQEAGLVYRHRADAFFTLAGK